MTSQAIVFIVGGGNYIEYQNLQDYSKVSVMVQHYSSVMCIWCATQRDSKNVKKITYGTSQMMCPNDFLLQVRSFLYCYGLMGYM